VAVAVAVALDVEQKNLPDAQRLAQQINALLDSDKEVNMSWCPETLTAELNGSTFQMTEDDYHRVITSFADTQVTASGDAKNFDDIAALADRIWHSDHSDDLKIMGSVSLSSDDGRTESRHFNSSAKLRDVMHDARYWTL
jgi:hypothetical protein